MSARTEQFVTLAQEKMAKLAIIVEKAGDADEIKQFALDKIKEKDERIEEKFEAI